ncbi:MAG: type III-B CRISPR module RAMP protein Cmr1 [Anaerolineales bacterium]|nr:type III-B CRISPR module RAMP protein Cmr1 [Anaerolineales bacterium]
MNFSKFTFECITPCFCAGADQSHAEIRPSSIRGELRWWFRILGGTHEQEAEVFGGVDPTRASSVQVRVANIRKTPVGDLPCVHGIDPLSYILHFPSVSGETKGMRWQANACYGAGSTFEIHLRTLRKFSEESRKLWESSILAFRHYGSIGMHATRALGAIQDKNNDVSSWQQADELLKSAGFEVRKANRYHEDWKGVVKEAGQWLQGDLRKEFGAGGGPKPHGKQPKATALGSAQPVRQTSALRLLPIKTPDGKLVFTAFEAPHQRVLGAASKRLHQEQILKSRDFTRKPPANKQAQRNRRR